ncbi:hypothetical protein CLOP_g15762 [Closterium sp. NIES-67]|nr:hypothetical protein CLOP_g15762 [Closterium sp. NIES-67]
MLASPPGSDSRRRRGRLGDSAAGSAAAAAAAASPIPAASAAAFASAAAAAAASPEEDEEEEKAEEDEGTPTGVRRSGRKRRERNYRDLVNAKDGADWSMSSEEEGGRKRGRGEGAEEWMLGREKGAEETTDGRQGREGREGIAGSEERRQEQGSVKWSAVRRKRSHHMELQKGVSGASQQP